MREIALHLLDIAENSVAANGSNICVDVTENLAADRLWARVQDDGKGMTPEMVAVVTDPFTTSRTTRKVGLGIPLIKEAAEACNGNLTICSELGQGTCLEVYFQHSHIDRMPLGDLAGTWLTLVVAHPEVHWLFTYQVTQSPESPGAGPVVHEFVFDDRPFKEAVEGLPLTEPFVLAYLKDVLQQGFSGVSQYLTQAA